MSKYLIQLMFFILLMSFSAQSAQSVLPYQDWKTLETEHFKIHYTNEYRDWAVSAAHEMEASVEAIKKSQNRKLPKKVDVVVFDPLNDSNGFALPFSTKPIMALYATPPLSDSIISNSSSWAQLLALHEYVHLVHLAQPSRNNLTKSLSNFWDIYDIALREDVQRWVAEGYATLQESRLTGRGRLYDAQVEAMIRQFAREGALPKYSQLSSTEGSYRIGSMAYLVGVRFLYWLEDNYSEQTLDAVWTRLQAKESRDFNEAFEGVFLESPEYLYQRFVAEYTYEVMAQEQQVGKSTSQLWYDAKFDLSSPVVSPDNTFIAFIETNSRGDSKIKVVELTNDGEAKKDFAKNNKELLENDPQDVANKTPKVFNNKTKYSLNERNFAGIRDIRWLDKENIIFSAKTQDKNGFLHQDLFNWELKSGKVKQLTFGANLRRFDIHPNGKSLVAEQTRQGKSGLVQIELDQLSQNTNNFITPFALDKIYDFPRFNPQGTALAYLQSGFNKPWSLFIKPLETEAQALLVPMPYEYQFLSYPSWSQDGEHLYFVAGSKDAVKLYRYEVVSQKLEAMTKGQELVSWPVELNQVQLEKDGEKNDWLMHVSIQSRGPDIFVKPLSASAAQPVSKLANQSDFDYLLKNTDSKVMMPDAALNLDASIGEERDYSIWDQDVTALLTGTEASASYGTSEIGIKGGDLLQRLNWQVSLMQGTHDLESGFSGSIAWQGWPVKLAGHVYQLKASDTVSTNFMPEVNRGDDNQLNGFYMEAAKPYQLASTTYKGEVSATYMENLSDWQDTKAVRLSHYQVWGGDRVKWGWAQHSKINILSGETDIATQTESWDGLEAELGLAIHGFGFKIAANYQYAERTGTDLTLLQFGGSQSGSLVGKGQANIIFAPEFALGAALGNEFENTKFSLSGRSSGFELYYSEPKMEGQKLAEVIGFAGAGSVDIFRAGLTNITISYGIAEVKPVNGDDEVEAWLSWFYQF